MCQAAHRSQPMSASVFLEDSRRLLQLCSCVSFFVYKYLFISYQLWYETVNANAIRPRFLFCFALRWRKCLVGGVLYFKNHNEIAEFFVFA